MTVSVGKPDVHALQVVDHPMWLPDGDQ